MAAAGDRARARVSVVRYESPDCGREVYVMREAAPHLRGQLFSIASGRVTRAAFLRRQIAASACVELRMNLEGTYTLFGAEVTQTIRRSDCVVGLRPSPIDTAAGTVNPVSVSMSPPAARRILGLPLSELCGDVAVPLGEIFGREFGELAERMNEACIEERIDILERYLERRLQLGQSEIRPDVAWAWQRLHETGGTIAIRTILDELRCSPRHLAMRFREDLGVTPKTAARLIRFQRAMHMLSLADGRAIWEIAHECGYYDHAHLDREFRKLAGVSPSEFVRRQIEFAAEIVELRLAADGSDVERELVSGWGIAPASRGSEQSG